MHSLRQYSDSNSRKFRVTFCHIHMYLYVILSVFIYATNHSKQIE